MKLFKILIIITTLYSIFSIKRTPKKTKNIYLQLRENISKQLTNDKTKQITSEVNRFKLIIDFIKEKIEEIKYYRIKFHDYIKFSDLLETSLVHIKPYLDQIPVNDNLLKYINEKKDFINIHSITKEFYLKNSVSFVSTIKSLFKKSPLKDIQIPLDSTKYTKSIYNLHFIVMIYDTTENEEVKTLFDKFKINDLVNFIQLSLVLNIRNDLKLKMENDYKKLFLDNKYKIAIILNLQYYLRNYFKEQGFEKVNKFINNHERLGKTEKYYDDELMTKNIFDIDLVIDIMTGKTNVNAYIEKYDQIFGLYNKFIDNKTDQDQLNFSDAIISLILNNIE